MTNPTNTFLHTLSNIAQHNDHRYGVVFDGDFDWQNSAVFTFLQDSNIPSIFQIGGTPFEGVIHTPVKKANNCLVVSAKFLFVILESSLMRMVLVPRWVR